MNKIYFCGSIRSGRELAATYAEVIKILQQYGEVLTEHVAYDSTIRNEMKSFSDKQIYERDRLWLEESDVVVAEVTIPSIGVGYEIGYAVQMKKQVLCLYNTNSEKKLSAMIAGCPEVELIYYNQVPGLKSAIQDFMKNASRQIP